MKTSTHPVTKIVEARCVSCSNTFETKTTKVNKELALDICSMCHPFYVGDTGTAKVAGRVERFNTKVSSVTGPTKKSAVKKSNKKAVSFADLEKELSK